MGVLPSGMSVLPGTRAPISGDLRAAVGTPRTVRALASSPRSKVWLVEFDRAPAIVKQVVGGPDARARYARELTALGLAARANPPVVPAVLGTDPDRRVMVLEHLASQVPTEDWPIHYATALARLHATTTAQDVEVLPKYRGPGWPDIAAFVGLATSLGVPMSARACEQLEHLCTRLADSGHALLHGDPCPGNDLHTGDGVRFVDLEHAALGDGLVELAYLRIGFPTCWCVTDCAPALREEAEQAYREQWRAETGREPSGDLADACAGWLIQGDALVQRAERGIRDQLARVVREDWKWGTTTARGRLLYRTGVVASVAGPDSELAEVGLLSRDLRDSMLRHWPELAGASLPTTRDFAS